MKKYVYMFSEGNEMMRDLLGGKGANLAAMVNLGLPVPQGFTVTTEACNEYYADGDEEKWNTSMQELADGGGFITGYGSRDFRTDIGEWIQLLVTESYDNIKRTYLDNNSMRAQKYEILVTWLKENFDWDIQACGNEFREKYDAYKATLPPPDPDEGSDESEETE